MRKRVLLLLLICIAPCWAYAQQGTDSFAVYFRLNHYVLDEAAKAHLDSLVYLHKLTDDQRLRIVGYADYVGSNGYNDTLSLRRAAAVRDYLLGADLKASNIELVAGRGEIARADMNDKSGYAPDRRVDILVNPHLRTVPFKRTEPAPHTALAPATVPPPKIDLSNVTENETMRLNNIYFYAGRHFVRDSSFAVLEELAEALRKNPTMRIRIEGHICCYTRGRDALDEDTNEPRLSYNRAKYIFQYLVSKGIAADRLEYTGFGRSRPLVPFERTDADADMNRRVEIRVLSR